MAASSEPQTRQPAAAIEEIGEEYNEEQRDEH